MKLIKALKWIFLVLGIVCFAALIALIIFVSRANELIAVWRFTENFMVNFLAIAAPLLLSLSAFMEYFQVVKRQFGRKKLPLGLALVFLGASAFSLLIFKTDGLRESLKELKSPDGAKTLYYIDGENSYEKALSVYSRKNFFEYDLTFYAEEENFDDIVWEEDGVEFGAKKYEYTEYSE